VLCGTTAFGRIGETEAQIEKRYGKPTPSSGATKTYSYKDFFIIVTFDNGVSAIETFQKRGSSPMPVKEIAAVLKANGRGESWSEPTRSGLKISYTAKSRFAEYYETMGTLTIAEYTAFNRIKARNEQP
jgi:hypothetical protein